MIGNIIDNIDSEEIDIILSQLYNKKFEYPGGEIYVLPNHFMTTTYYLLTVDTVVTYDNIISPNINLNPSGYLYILQTTTCHFDKNIEDGKYEKDYLPIIFIQDMTLNVSKVLTSYISTLFNNFTNEV